MNTATSSARVHFHGSFFVVTIGDKSYTCLNKSQLIEALCGRPPIHPEPPPPPTRETPDQFFARGGKITRVSRTAERPLPETISEPIKPIPSRVSFANLFGSKTHE